MKKKYLYQITDNPTQHPYIHVKNTNLAPIDLNPLIKSWENFKAVICSKNSNQIEIQFPHYFSMGYFYQRYSDLKIELAYLDLHTFASDTTHLSELIDDPSAGYILFNHELQTVDTFLRSVKPTIKYTLYTTVLEFDFTNILN